MPSHLFVFSNGVTWSTIKIIPDCIQSFFLGKLKDSVKNEIEDLVEKVNEKLDEIDNESKANAGHVDNLRDVNKELLERIKVNVQDDIDKHTGNKATIFVRTEYCMLY